MRPVCHPAIEDVTVEGILYALADAERVAIFLEIVGSNCAQSCSMAAKASDRPIPRSTLSLHFRVLREAGLIRGERMGVEMQNTSRCLEIDARFPGLLTAILGAYRIQAGSGR